MRTGLEVDTSIVQYPQNPTSPLPAVACISMPSRPVEDLPSKNGTCLWVSVYSIVVQRYNSPGFKINPFSGSSKCLILLCFFASSVLSTYRAKYLLKCTSYEFPPIFFMSKGCILILPFFTSSRIFLSDRIILQVSHNSLFCQFLVHRKSISKRIFIILRMFFVFGFIPYYRDYFRKKHIGFFIFRLDVSYIKFIGY